MSLYYCFGIIGDKIDNSKIDLTAFDSKKVNFFQFKDIKAAYCEVEESIFSQDSIDKNAKKIEWIEKYGRVHEEIVEAIRNRTTIIPMKFCTIFTSTDKLKESMEEKYADFKFNLHNLEGMDEISVKVYYDSQIIRDNISQEDEEIKKLEESAKDKKPGAYYFEKQKIESLLAEKLNKKLDNNRKKILIQLKPHCKDFKQNELLSKKLTKRDMLLNGVFLTKNKDSKLFMDLAIKLGKDFKDLEVEVWGPFPPYNFVR
jgi:hypothetical protein